MKIIIPIKRVLDPYTQARVNKQTQLVDLTNAKMAMNPFCEIAVEEALKIKESGAASETIAVSIGTEKTVDTLRTALAMGGEIDSGIETRQLNLPAIVTVDLRLNEPRYASLPNIMKARSKPLETIEISSFDIDISPRVKVVSVEESGTKDRTSKQVHSAEELFSELSQLGVL